MTGDVGIDKEKLVKVPTESRREIRLRATDKGIVLEIMDLETFKVEESATVAPRDMLNALVWLQQHVAGKSKPRELP